jgi:murein DD-endopeptidase MepM/ murein hydrolase activator NlpD
VSRLSITTILVLAALAGVAFAMSGRGGDDERGSAEAARAQVVDLGSVRARPAAALRPSEEVSDADQAAVERQIKAQSSPDAATTDDGISPGAPSDKEVRAALRKMYGGAAIARGGGDLIRPIGGAFTSPFGMRWGRLHAGIDLAAPVGTPIRAAAAGRVILMAPNGGYGNYTCIDHGRSISTCYAHQSRFGTRRGASVMQGQVIGYVGNTGNSTGPHLHFEVRISGKPVDPMDYL